MIELYHCIDARSFRPLWVLEEMGLKYQLHVMPFPPRATTPEYKKLNPLGTIPLFIDGTICMTESTAIGHYLAVRYGPSPLAVDAAEPDFGAFLNWNVFGEATLTFPQTLVLRYKYFESPERRQPQVADDYARWFLARLRAIEAALDCRNYLCAGRFTVADVSVGYALLLASSIGLADQFSPRVATYWTRLQLRDGFHRAKQAQQAAADNAGLKLGTFGIPEQPHV